METKHTPGPWVYEESSGYVRCHDGSAVADAYESLEKPQSDINGRLIAAAPDLLHALETLVNAAYNIGGENVTGWERLEHAADAGVAAVVKATGAAT